MMVCLNGLFDDGMLECLRLFSLKKHMISKIFRGGVLFDFNRIKGRYKSCRECSGRGHMMAGRFREIICGRRTRGNPEEKKTIQFWLFPQGLNFTPDFHLWSREDNRNGSWYFVVRKREREECVYDMFFD